MKNWWKDFKIKSAMNSRTAQIRALARQVEFLNAHPEIGVVGTASQTIDAQGRLVHIHKPAIAPLILKWRLSFENPLIHPSIMMRRELIEDAGGYDERFKTAQDYDLCSA